MKQLNASLAALRARQHDALSMGLVQANSGTVEGSLNSNSNSMSLSTNNGGVIGSHVIGGSAPVVSQPQEQETSLNLSTSGNWQLKKEPTQGNE